MGETEREACQRLTQHRDIPEYENMPDALRSGFALSSPFALDSELPRLTQTMSTPSLNL
jgi:hypothetical protein